MRVTFAGQLLDGTPATEWGRLDKRIEADPALKRRWPDFEELLQTNLLPKVVREFKHYEELKTLRQRPNQSVGDFLALFESIEHQLQNEMPDWIGKLFILTGVHPHLKDALRLNGRLGETRAELEENLRDIEGVAAAPQGVTAPDTYRLTSQNGSEKKKLSNRREKGSSGRTRGSGHRLQRRPIGQKTSPPPSNATADKKDPDPSALKCFNCRKKGHRASDCPAPDVRVKSGKAPGQ